MKHIFNFKINVEVFKDKDSKCWIYSNKKYNVAGYGYTRKKAKQSLAIQLNEILTFKKK